MYKDKRSSGISLFCIMGMLIITSAIGSPRPFVATLLSLIIFSLFIGLLTYLYVFISVVKEELDYPEEQFIEIFVSENVKKEDSSILCTTYRFDNTKGYSNDQFLKMIEFTSGVRMIPKKDAKPLDSYYEIIKEDKREVVIKVTTSL